MPVREIEWNAVATAGSPDVWRARALMERFGEVETTPFRGVFVLRVDDANAFLAEYAERYRVDPRLAECLGRVIPLTETFDFASPDAFEAEAKRIAIGFAPQLAGKSFHVRMHRRGFKGEFSSQAEEQFLDEVLLNELERLGQPGRISFDDPDAILDVETVGERGGLSLWSREDLERYPFLKLD